jgi:hypothetical protein
MRHTPPAARIALLAPALLTCVAAARADGGAKADDLPAPARLEQRLKTLLREACPGANFDRPEDDKLVVRFKTRTFQVHGPYRTGEFTEKPSPEEGPTARGFLLTVQVRPEAYDGPLVVPQTLNRPYWRTYINDYRAGRQYLFVGLSYGAAPDEKLLAKLKEAVASFAREEDKRK